MRRGRGSKRKGLHLTAPPLLSPPRDPQIGLSSLSVAAAAAEKPPPHFRENFLSPPRGSVKNLKRGRRVVMVGRRVRAVKRLIGNFHLTHVLMSFLSILGPALEPTACRTSLPGQ